MGPRDLWSVSHGAVCQLVHLRNGVRLGSGSGFLTEARRLVTNNHVIQNPGANEVQVRFVGPDGHTSLTQKSFSADEFRARVLDGEPETSWDYAILDMDIPELASSPFLKLAEYETSIGSPVALLGFQFEQANLSLHAGVVSSTYSNATVDYIQLDASVNHGNSGGPLIDCETGRVVGIVTRKATGLTQRFDELIQSFEENARAFQAVQGTVGLSGIDVFKVLTITQHQMRMVSIEIARSANVGIGYAYSVRQIHKSLQLLR